MNEQLRKLAIDLAMRVLQSPMYKEEGVKEIVDDIILLTLSK